MDTYARPNCRRNAAGVGENMATGEVTPTGLQKSNVLYFDLEDDAWFCVRPSGTEPKIKYYAGVKGTSLEDAEHKLEGLMNTLKD